MILSLSKDHKSKNIELEKKIMDLYLKLFQQTSSEGNTKTWRVNICFNQF
jgi:hypothetical protein